MIQQISCMLTDVIRSTLASCDYRDCSQSCLDYLNQVGLYCSAVFNNEVYAELWRTLKGICESINEETAEINPYLMD
jgi:hypothetical protein